MPRWDVTVTFEGPTTSTDNAAVRFCGTAGGTGQNSGLIVSDCSSATFSSGGLNIACGDAYSIDGTSVLNATTLGTAVINSSLTGVGALTTGGSIAAGFGNIDNGTSNITSGGIWSVDVDSGATINSSGGGLAAAGALTFGAGADAGLYVSGDNLYVENKTSDKDLIFRVNDGGTFKEVARVVGSVAAMKFSEITDPGDPGGGNGGYLYAKADGKPYWRSNEIAEVALDGGGGGGGTTINNNTANRLVTVAACTDELCGEACFTFQTGALAFTRGGACTTPVFTIANYSATEDAPATITLQHSLHNTVGSHTTITDGTELGLIEFRASDGDSFEVGAQIKVENGQDWSASQHQSEMQFWTTNVSSTTLTKNLTLEGSGILNLMGNSLRAGDGTAASPAVSIGDSDTGFYKIGHDTIGIAAGGAEQIRLDLAGGGHRVGINCTDPSGGTTGLWVNGCCDPHIVLANSSVSHSFTGCSRQADTFATFSKAHNGGGGLMIDAYRDSGGSNFSALLLRGSLDETPDTTHSAGGYGVVTIRATKTNGSNGFTQLGSCENVFSVDNHTCTKLIIAGDGDVFASDSDLGGGLDDFCDPMLMRSTELVRLQNSCYKGIIKSRYDDWTRDHYADLEAAGLYNTPPWEGGLLNTSQWRRLANGAIWQLYTTVQDQAAEILGLKQDMKALKES